MFVRKLRTEGSVTGWKEGSWAISLPQLLRTCGSCSKPQLRWGSGSDNCLALELQSFVIVKIDGLDIGALSFPSSPYIIIKAGRIGQAGRKGGGEEGAGSTGLGNIPKNNIFFTSSLKSIRKQSLMGFWTSEQSQDSIFENPGILLGPQ